MIRKASAVWNGSLKEGKGTISTDSKVLSNAQYSFSTRFENGIGTNPEELIAAAHAGCFSMALSAQLGGAGITPESIETTAAVSLEKTDARIYHYKGSPRCNGKNSRSGPGWYLIRLRKTPRRVARSRGCSRLKLR